MLLCRRVHFRGRITANTKGTKAPRGKTRDKQEALGCFQPNFPQFNTLHITYSSKMRIVCSTIMQFTLQSGVKMEQMLITYGLEKTSTTS